MAGGRNPMMLDCERQGCFNVKKRLKLERFADCFPGKIGMGDVDGIVEINGHFLVLEWKAPGVALSTGQRIMYERMTRDDRFTVVFVEGDAEHMSVERTATIRGGRLGRWRDSSFSQLHAGIKQWCDVSMVKP